MQHLKDLGVDTNKASMAWVAPNRILIPALYDSLNDQGVTIVRSMAYSSAYEGFRVFDAFTLQDIIELLPKYIEVESVEREVNTYYLIISPEWKICYEEAGFPHETEKSCESKILLDAAYEMLCWCAENGHLKGGEK